MSFRVCRASGVNSRAWRNNDGLRPPPPAARPLPVEFDRRSSERHLGASLTASPVGKKGRSRDRRRGLFRSGRHRPRLAKRGQAVEPLRGAIAERMIARHLRPGAARGRYFRQLYEQRPPLGVLDRPGAGEARPQASHPRMGDFRRRQHRGVDGEAPPRGRPHSLRDQQGLSDQGLFELGAPGGAVGRREQAAELRLAGIHRGMRSPDSARAVQTMRPFRTEGRRRSEEARRLLDAGHEAGGADQLPGLGRSRVSAGASL